VPLDIKIDPHLPQGAFFNLRTEYPLGSGKGELIDPRIHLCRSFDSIEIDIALKTPSNSFLAGGGIFPASIGASNSGIFVGSYLKTWGILIPHYGPLLE
jgi:hypothetical protein